MEAWVMLVILAVLALALFALSQPFWPGQEEKVQDRDALLRADLEAAKVAKYREIRDAELDHQTGKLSEDDWKTIDRRLRGEAVAILDRIDDLGDGTTPASAANARL